MPSGARRRHGTERVVLAGLASGALVLGLGGRVLMRVLALTTPEPPRFTLEGSLQVLAVGAVWGAVTAPLLLVAEGRFPRLGRSKGPLLGLAVLVLAAAALLLIEGAGEIVAPRSFIVLSSLLFPALFVVHGVAVEKLWRLWTSRGPVPTP